MRDALRACVVLAAACGLSVQAAQNVTAHRITTDHLQITTYASEAVVAPGSVFSLVFEIRPRDRIHVYAPGAKGYQIIRVAIDPNPALVMRPVQYPASEMYFFQPLNERVPVFQQPFRLTQAMAVSTAPEHRALLAKGESVTIKGTLNYQACDDRVCFLPKSVPVSYTVKLRPPDATRPAAAR